MVPSRLNGKCFKYPALFCCIAAVLLFSGCVTGNGTSTETATYKHVKNLSRSIDQLNQTSAELSVQVQGSEYQTRLLQSMVEENRVRIEHVQASLDEMTTTLYRHFNLSPPTRYPQERFRIPDELNIQQEGISLIPPPVEVEQEKKPSWVIPVEKQEKKPEKRPEVRMESSNPLEEYRRIIKYYMDDSYEEAIAQFDAYLKAFPDTDYCANAQFWKAQCYVKMEQLEKAIDEFKLLRAKYPDSAKVPTAMHQQAVAYALLGETELAIILFERVLEDYPMDPATEGVKKKLEELKKGTDQNL